MSWYALWTGIRSIFDVTGRRTYAAFMSRPRCTFPGCDERFRTHTDMFWHQSQAHRN